MISTACLLLLAYLAIANGSSIRGLNPDLSSHYSGSGGTFTCISGKQKTFPFARVNDDYCDCPDGSDEPGTSACHNGRFYCRNLGHEPRLLSASFVDDGVCDCCDGTDEAKGKCQNTCLQASAVHKEALKAKISQYEANLATKAGYVTKARAFKEELQSKAPGIDDRLAAHRAEVERLRDVVRVEQDREEAARHAAEAERLAAEEDAREAAAAAAAAAAEAEKAAEGASAEIQLSGGSEEHVERALNEEQTQPEAEREETPEERGRRIASQWTNDPDAAAVPKPEDGVTGDEGEHDEHEEHDDDQAPVDYPAPDDEQELDDEYPASHQYRAPAPSSEGEGAAGGRGASAERAEAAQLSEWDDFMMFVGILKDWAANWWRTLAKIWKEGIRQDVLEFRERNQARHQHRHRQERAERRAWETESPSRADATDPNSPLAQARARVEEAERVLQQLEQDKENIATFHNTGIHLGPDDMFLGLANQCFTSYQTRWNYEVCMFKNAVQREGHTNSVTVGRWAGFSPDYGQLLYGGGDECAGVGPRTMIVTLSCGSENKLSDCEEPATCGYACKMTSPAACNQGELAALHKQLHDLEAWEKEVAAQIAKDEL